MKRIYILTTLLLSAAFASAQCTVLQSNPNPCANSTAYFSIDNPSGSYAWDFTDDGNMDAYGNTVTYNFPESNIDLSYPVSVYEDGVHCNTVNVMVLGIPDPTIGVIPGSGTLEGDQIRVCSGTPNINLIIYNISATYQDNESYEINWGDGTIENFDNTTFPNSATINHNYSAYGYYSISVSVTGTNGCSETNQYTLYNGSNPSVGLANPGNTVGLCVPATIDFPITNTNNNPTGTIYTIYIGGEAVALYNQENIPAVFSYTFLEHSCGKETSTGNYQNAYDVNIEASNPCGSSQATIEPIELSEPPEPEFEADEPNLGCEGEVITFTNTSDDGGEVTNGDCTSLVPSWSISPGVPGVHWEIVSGNTFASEEIEVIFLIPGTYTITMTVNSASCGIFDFTQTFEIFEDVDVDATGSLVSASSPGSSDDCLPTIAIFENQSTGDSLTFTWEVSPSSGWEYIDPFDENSTDLQINFLEPGSYNVALSAGGYCGDAGWDTTLVIADVPEAIITNIPNQCAEGYLNFDAFNVDINANFGNISAIEWSFPGGSPSSSTETYPTNIYYDSPGTYDINVTITNQCGTSTSTTQTFTVEPIGVVTIGDNMNICETTNAFSLTATPTGGTWSGNGITPNGLFTPSENNIGDNVLIYSVEDGVCSLSDSLIVTVTPAPEIDLPNEQSLCLIEAAYDLSAATPAGGTWSGSGISGSTFDPALAGVGTHSITYDYLDPISGCSNSETMEMEVLPLPALTANDTAYCNTLGLVALPFAQPMGGAWSGNGVVGNSFDPQAAGGIGNYNITYTYTDGNGCTNTTEALISIVSPDQVDAGDDLESCVSSDPVDLSQFATPSGGSWTANGSLGLNGSVFNPTLAGVGTHTITYTIGSGNCQVSDDLEITVYPKPSVSVMNDFEICVNEAPVDLTATPAGGTWTAIDGGSIMGNVFNPSATGEGVFTFTYTYADGFGCENSDDLVVTIVGIPNIETTDATFCNTPGVVLLPVAEPTGGTWTGPGVVNNGFDPEVAGGIGSYNIMYTFVDNNGCSNSANATITVISPENINAGNDFDICVYSDPFDLSQLASPAGGVWTANGSAGLNGSIFTPSFAGIGVHTLTYTIGSGNCQVSDDIEINVHPAPIVEAMDDFEICLNEDPIALSATPVGGTWTPTNGGSLIGNVFNPTTSGAGVYSFSYHYTDSYGCENTDDVVITVFGIPNITTTNATYCDAPGVVALPYAEPTGGTWAGPGVVNNGFDPQAAGGVGSYNIMYTFTDNNGCSNSENATITVISPENINAGNDFDLCIYSDPFDLSQLASPAGGVWMANGSAGLNGSIFNPSFAGLGTHTLTYTLGSGNCQVSDDIEISVHPAPIVEAMDDFELCLNEDPVNLTATPIGGNWVATNGGNLVGNVFDPTTSGEGVYAFSYNYTDSYGCESTDEVVVTVFGIPNIITTNVSYCDAPGIVALPTAEPAGGNWSGAGVVTNGFDPVAAGGVGTYTLTYIVTDNNTCTNTATAIVTVIATDIIDAGTPDTICIDQGLFQLSGFSPMGGVWSGNGIVDANQGVFDPMVAGAGLHTLNYSKGTGNCFVEDVKTIMVIDLTVSAGPDEEFCLLDNAVILDNNTPQGGLWSGTGITDAITGLFDPGVANVGTHIITYTFTDTQTGCIRSDNKEITILDIDEAQFTMPDFACRNETINFENLSPDGYEYFWSFGQSGETSTQQNPSYTYTVAGTYTVTLIIENAAGCADTTAHDIQIADVPVALFDASSTENCAGDSVLFFDQSFGDSLSYLWTFGDFYSSTEQDPGVIFFQQGFYDTTYLVTLTVSNICGSHTFQDVILVHPRPIADFGLVPITECSPLVIEFANATTGAATGFFWDFGNGNTSTEQFPESQTYFTGETTTVYDIMMIATNDCGSDTVFSEVIVEPANVVASAEVSTDAGCVPLIVDFSNFSTPGALIDWDFGDGNTSSQAEPTHTFTSPGTFTVIQYANSECGYDTSTLVITVYPEPEVSFTHANAICSEQEVVFENNSINTSGHYWDFGDGTTSTENNPIHIYGTPGEYTVTLMGVSQFNQCQAYFESTITILDLPIAGFTPSTTYGCAPLVIDFENNSSAALFYHWDFGDGNSTISMSPTHTFEEPGTYAVTLLATDAYGCFEDITVYNIIVTPNPEAYFDFEKESVCGLPATINFVNNSIDGLQFEWHFGQGSTSVETDPSYTYTEAGVYEVTLIAFNQFSCTDTMTLSFEIFDDPVAGIEVEGIDGCAPVSVRFLNNSLGSTEYYWDFGDGNTSNETSPRHLFENPGTYEVKLVATINNVCPDTTVILEPIQVYPMVFANFEAEQIGNDGTYDILNLSENADTYFWEFSDGAYSELESPSHRFNNNGVQQIYLEATNQYGCMDDTLVSFVPEFVKGLFLPNAFSPEQGIGDVRLFKAKGIGLKEYRLQIFSTYGQLLWESTTLDDDGRPSEGWDGIVDGELMPQDSYVWKCSGIFLDGSSWIGVEEGNRRKVMGTLVLLR